MRLSRRTGPTRKKRHRTFVSLTPIGAVCALFSLAVLARAEDAAAPNDPIAVLRVYVQQVAAAPPKATTAENSHSATAGLVRVGPDAVVGLRAFVQSIHDESAQSTGAHVKFAEADNAFDALREFLPDRQLSGHYNFKPVDQLLQAGCGRRPELAAVSGMEREWRRWLRAV